MAERLNWRSVLDDVDDETVLLMIKLQLDDIEALATTDAVGMQPEDDGVIARQTYAAELNLYRAIRHSAPSTPEPAFTTVQIHGHIPRFECVSCTDRVPVDDCYQVPCQHYYYDVRLETLFRQAMTDRRLYPIRCCQQFIPYEDVRIFLTEKLRQEFESKKQELDDLHPVYCHMPTCSTYIGHEHREDGTGDCQRCDAKTCLTCSGTAHSGDCPSDEALQSVLSLAQQEGWRRCDACKQMVELTVGCYHMMCRCSAQFCYLCGATWKTCVCQQFAEHHLLNRAEEIVHRDGGDVDAMVEHLRENHECREHVWIDTRGVHDCEGCGDTLREYIFRCQQCHTQMCRRCIYNRM